MIFALLALALAKEAAPPAVDSLAARAQVRKCLSLQSPDEEALAACRQAVALGLNPAWSDAIRAYVARRLAALARVEEAVEVYRSLAAERPADAGWPLRLGSLLLMGLGRVEQAEAALREALARDPDRAEAWALLGLALHSSARPEEAGGCFRRARDLDPEYFETRPALAEAERAALRGTVWP